MYVMHLIHWMSRGPRIQPFLLLRETEGCSAENATYFPFPFLPLVFCGLHDSELLRSSSHVGSSISGTSSRERGQDSKSFAWCGCCGLLFSSQRTKPSGFAATQPPTTTHHHHPPGAAIRCAPLPVVNTSPNPSHYSLPIPITINL